MDTVVESPKQAPNLTPDNSANKEDVQVYQGNVNKMEVFNNGENGQDRAVPFQLRLGTQAGNGPSFALNISEDPNKPAGTVVNLEDSRNIEQMSDKAFGTTALIEQNGKELILSMADIDPVHLTPDAIKANPYTIHLDSQTGVEIRGFDPENRTIIIHKVHSEKGPVAPIPPAKFGWFRKRVIDIAGTLTIGAAILGGSGSADATPQVHTTIVDQAPAGPPASEVQNIPKIPEVDPLKCDNFQDYEIKSGDSLTGALVKVNGIGRYLDEDGKLSEKELYIDLACMLVQDSNQAAIRQSDEKVANFIDSLKIPNADDLIGKLTPDTIIDGLNAINTGPNGEPRIAGTHKRLVIIQPGQHFLVPNFQTK